MLIDFISKRVAERIEPKESWAIISIREPDEKVRLHKDWQYVLPLEFHDTDGVKATLVKQVPVEDLVKFNEEHAKQIFKFVEELPKNVRTIMVHCYGGISRSAAVAKFLREIVYGHPFPPSYTIYNKLVHSVLREVWADVHEQTAGDPDRGTEGAGDSGDIL